MFRGGRALIGALFAAVVFGATPVCTVAVSATATESDVAPIQVKIVTDLEQPPESASTLMVRAPIDPVMQGRLERLRRVDAKFSLPYRKALTTALEAGGVFSEDQASNALESARELPRVEIADGEAAIALRTYWRALWYEMPEDSGHLYMEQIDVPESARLQVVLRTGGEAPKAALPLPQGDDNKGKVWWTFGPGSSSDVSVHLGHPVGEAYGFNYAQSIVSFLAAGLPFLLLGAIFLGRKKEEGEDAESQRLPSLLRKLGAAGLVLTAAEIGFFVYYEQAIDSQGSAFRLVQALIPATGLVVYVALAWQRWKVPLAIAIALSVGFGLLLMPRAALITSPRLTHVERGELELLASLIVGLALLAIVLIASWRWLPPLLRRSSWDRVKYLDLILIAGLLALVVTFALQLLLAAGARSYQDGFAAGEPHLSAELGSLLEQLPYVVANLARNLGITLMAVGLAVWLWVRSGNAELDLSDWRERLALAVLIGTGVVGLGGEIRGYSAPIPFLLAVVAVFVGAKIIAGSERVRVACSEDTRNSAVNLLERATRLATLRRRRHAVAEEATTAACDPAACDKRLEEIENARQELIDAPSVGSLPVEDRSREILALGLLGSGGARERFSTVVNRGWPILAFPATYTAIALIDRSGSGVVSAEQAYGLVFLFAALLMQISMWPIGAWVFTLLMPFLPGRVGVLKGLVAGVLVALAPALASLVLDDVPGAEDWLFISAELTLMFVAVGLFLDTVTVRSNGGDLRRLGDLYSITSARAALAYLAPLALLLGSVIHGLATGNGASALQELATHAQSLLPPGG
jgi:hypothetical protein